jgi:hypothetical protein
MSQGLKNLQTAARAHARRERMLDTDVKMGFAYGRDPHVDDSGISLDDLEAEYDANSNDGASIYGGPGHIHSYGSVDDDRHRQKKPLSSVDVGIDAILNRSSNRSNVPKL